LRGIIGFIFKLLGTLPCERAKTEYTELYTLVFNKGNTTVLTIAGKPQRRISLLVLDVNMCTTPEDELHKLVVTFIGCDSEGSVSRAGHRCSIHICTLDGEGE